MIDEDVPEDEVSEDVVELNLGVPDQHDHPHSVSQQQIMDSREETLYMMLYFIAEQQCDRIEEKVPKRIGVEYQEDGTVSVHVIVVYLVKSR